MKYFEVFGIWGGWDNSKLESIKLLLSDESVTVDPGDKKNGLISFISYKNIEEEFEEIMNATGKI